MTLDELEAQRAAIPDDDQLPASATRADLAAVQKRRRDLDARISRVKEAMARIAALPDLTADVAWIDTARRIRESLVDERMAIKSPIRDSRLLGLAKNLEVSIRALDHGPHMFDRDGNGYCLENSRLGVLMREAGYVPVGADPSANFTGRMPWPGTPEECEHRIKAAERIRTQAQAQIDDALLDDEERAKQEVEAKELRDAYNSLDVQFGDDSTAARPTLVVKRGGELIDESTLTPLQQRALARAREAFATT